MEKQAWADANNWQNRAFMGMATSAYSPSVLALIVFQRIAADFLSYLSLDKSVAHDLRPFPRRAAPTHS